MTRAVVLAGGGTAGHVNPMLATAAALRAARPDLPIVCVGTARGLETTLVPEAGFPLELVDPVPLPRKPSLDLAKLPVRLLKARRQARAILTRDEAAVVVGFGGYASLPVYLAARGRVPIVVHEGNAIPGLANRVGARFAAVVATATAVGTLRGSRVVGMPLRASVTSLDRAGLRAQGATYFDLDPDRLTLLVYGGSQGARTLNLAAVAAAGRLRNAGVQVLHAYGRKNEIDVPDAGAGPAYQALPYIDRMDLAYAVCDMAVCRAGMSTVAELTAVGLPALYVPLPHGNGEQRLNAQPVVDHGGGLMVRDEELDGARLAEELLPVLTDDERLRTMAGLAADAGHAEAADTLAGLVLEVAGL